MTVKPMWTEGLFLTPQHLQLADDYHEKLIEQRVGAIAPNLWGVAQLEIDLDELARGIVQVSRLTAVMPDGMLLQVGADQPTTSLHTQVPNAAIRSGRPVEVYLGIPGRRAAGAAADGEGATSGMRFVENARVVSDVYGHAEDAEVQCVRPNAQLLLGTENRQGYVTLKIAELIVGDAGRLVPSPRYIPPSLHVNVSGHVMSQLSRVVASLAEKQKVLLAKYGDRSAAMVEFGAADMATFWYLHTVNTWLPVFMHHADAGQAHPERIYLALASFCGQLSTFEATHDPLDLPKFRFDDIGGSLLPMFEKVLRLLGSVVSARYTQIPLEQTQPGLFVGQVDDPTMLTRRALYLMAGGEVSEEALRDDVPRFLKVGSIDQIAQIVQSALPGVGVRIDMSPPSALPVRSHLVYMRIERSGRYWDAVKHSGTIAIYQPVKPSRVKLELVAVEAS